MANIKKGNFLLTEIALQLLGNKLYDINGHLCQDMDELFLNDPLPIGTEVDQSHLNNVLELKMPHETESLLVPMKETDRPKPGSKLNRKRKIDMDETDLGPNYIQQIRKKIIKEYTSLVTKSITNKEQYFKFYWERFDADINVSHDIVRQFHAEEKILLEQESKSLIVEINNLKDRTGKTKLIKAIGEKVLKARNTISN